MKFHSSAAREHPAFQVDKSVHDVIDDRDDSDDYDTESEISPIVKETDEVIIITDKETRAVRNVKYIVVLVLLISIAGAIAIYLYIKNSEQTQFENSFNDDANKVRNLAIASSKLLSRNV
jgi:hypothetical protein